MPKRGPGERSKIGARVLTAAEVVNVSAIRERLATFVASHRRYQETQAVVAAIEAKRRAAQAELLKLDREQDHAVEHLAGKLAAIGRSRVQPFEGLRVPPPAQIRRLEMGREAKTIHRLVLQLRRVHSDESVLRAAKLAETAANAVESAIKEIKDIDRTLRSERLARDIIGRSWDHDLTALKSAARLAEHDGAADLHRLLFR